MAYIPSDAKEYVADIIEVITVEIDPRNVVHTNTVLVSAASPEEAYEKAISLGRQDEISYKNPAGKHVQISFRGLGQLVVIHDELEHGAELMYDEKIGLSNEEVQSRIVPKEQLSVFRPVQRIDGPDYSSNDVMDDVSRLLRDSRQ